MAARTLTGFIDDAIHRREARIASTPPLVRQRRRTALALMAGTIVLAVLLAVAIGPVVLLVYLPGLPIGFILLWASTEALRFDERAPGDEEGSPS